MPVFGPCANPEHGMAPAAEKMADPAKPPVRLEMQYVRGTGGKSVPANY